MAEIIRVPGQVFRSAFEAAHHARSKLDRGHKNYQKRLVTTQIMFDTVDNMLTVAASDGYVAVRVKVFEGLTFVARQLPGVIKLKVSANRLPAGLYTRSEACFSKEGEQVQLYHGDGYFKLAYADRGRIEDEFPDLEAVQERLGIPDLFPEGFHGERAECVARVTQFNPLLWADRVLKTAQPFDGHAELRWRMLVGKDGTEPTVVQGRGCFQDGKGEDTQEVDVSIWMMGVSYDSAEIEATKAKVEAAWPASKKGAAT